MAKDRGCPAQRRPVARVQHQRLYWFQKALPFLSLPFLPSNAFTEEERDCVSVPAAAKKKKKRASGSGTAFIKRAKTVGCKIHLKYDKLEILQKLDL